MSDTANRLAAYKQAELAILTGPTGQRVRMGDRDFASADLMEIRKAISDLTAQLAFETQASRGGNGFLTSVGGFNPMFRGPGREGCDR